eukprot:m.303200 g.303200  ORF g.303200 m.303200 type:complete len:93 (-) comp15747_c0_seq1:378-656(-)
MSHGQLSPLSHRERGRKEAPCTGVGHLKENLSGCTVTFPQSARAAANSNGAPTELCIAATSSADCPHYISGSLAARAHSTLRAQWLSGGSPG